jgi:hypothetical protein
MKHARRLSRETAAQGLGRLQLGRRSRRCAASRSRERRSAACHQQEDEDDASEKAFESRAKVVALSGAVHFIFQVERMQLDTI